MSDWKSWEDIPADTATAYERGVIDERARCVKVLEELRDSERHSDSWWVASAFTKFLGALAVAATPPVSAAPVVPPEPSLAYCYTCAHLLSAHVPGKRHCVYCDSPDPWKNPYYPKANAGSPVVPAATDEPALAVIRKAINEACNDPLTTGDFYVDPQGFAAALRSAGYVLLPRKELDELLDASLHVGRYLEDTGGPYRGWLAAARAAVVEAVGPIREDTSNG